jgi:metallophosphoesterase superfamily enzyme
MINTLTSLIDEYAELVKKDNISYSLAAKKLLKNNPSIEVSHRTLRRKLAQAVNNKVENMNEKKNIEETESSKKYQYEGSTSITSKEQAIKFFKIDLKKEKIVRCSYRSWDVTMKIDGKPVKRTNYMVRVDTEVNQQSFDYEKVTKDIDKLFKVKRLVTDTNNGSGTIMVSIADIHIGAKASKAKGLINTKDFSLAHLIKYLNQTASKINSLNKSEVYVAIQGDLVESLTGLNHLNSWQGMEEDIFGANSLIIAEQVIGKFLEQIKNLKTVYMVSGNHDRIHPDKHVDATGEVAKIVAYMLSKNFNVKYHSMVLSTKIDGIGYVIFHGHQGLSKQNLSKIILDYGFKGCYNVCLSGHLHSRNTKKEFYKMDHIIQDSAQYRGIVVAPLFTGNYYSESSGWTSSAGFSIIEANEDKSNITHYDIGL